MAEQNKEVINQGLITFQSISELRATNRPVIEDKITRALAAMSVIKTIDTAEEDKYANDLLVKINATIPVVENLRKEYTGKVDEWKSQEMALENKLKDEASRIKKERDAFATREFNKANKAKAEIEAKQAKEKEIGRIKIEMVAGIELGIAERIAKGETAISKMFDALTIETIDQAHEAFSFLPKLPEDFYKGLVNDFNKYDAKLVTPEELADIKAKCLAAPKFDYKVIAEKYVELVRELQKKWKAKLPERKQQLLKMSVDASLAETIKAQIAETSKKDLAQINSELQEKKEAVNKDADEKKAEVTIKTSFDAQIATQGVTEQEGTRKKIVIRFTDEDKLINDNLETVQILGKVMLHVLTDKNFLGVFERTKDKFVKKDPDSGLPIYIDEVQGWLNLLAKIKPLPTIQGLTVTEGVTSTARKGK
jgi:hypothetical protein